MTSTLNLITATLLLLATLYGMEGRPTDNGSHHVYSNARIRTDDDRLQALKDVCGRRAGEAWEAHNRDHVFYYRLAMKAENHGFKMGVLVTMTMGLAIWWNADIKM